jgi:carboxyl-terminal processing protease
VIRFQEYLNIKETAKVTFVAYHQEMKLLIKAALADQLYGSNASEEIINATDDMIEEVLKLIKTQ